MTRKKKKEKKPSKKEKKPSKKEEPAVTKEKPPTKKVFAGLSPSPKPPSFMAFPTMTEEMLLQSVPGKIRTRRRRWNVSMRGVFQRVLIVALGVLFSLYIRWKFVYQFPYCEAGSRQDGWCIPCPANGKCVGGKLVCDYGYRQAQSVWLGMKCVPDRKKQTETRRAARRAVDIVRSSCGEQVGRSGSTEEPFVDEEELKEKLKKEGGVFEETMLVAMENGVVCRTEIRGRVGYTTQHPKVPWKTRGLKLMAGVWRSHYREISVGTSAVLVLLFVYLKSSARLQSKEATDRIVKDIVEMLIEQERIHRADPSIPAVVSVSQTRDLFLLGERSGVWRDVLQRLGSNTNIREKIAKIRGESLRVWEWVGVSIPKRGRAV
ncbi:MAG: uncharacterized protein A8A55_0767 [Amphiamblys sp. WSBS2006]|nr:MAG: uncharacterized protein A8A55_0767 [Amphiamblys sp. WSBS2006]